MFTGIIEALGSIVRVDTVGGDRRMVFRAPGLLAGTQIGDSIAVNGVCLTAIEFGDDSFAADLSAETLNLTTAGRWQIGDGVNLERALTPAKPLGGHMVVGHVDGVGTLVERSEDARSTRMRFELPDALARYVARKGSICINGVSLTVNDVAVMPDALQTAPPSPAARARDESHRPQAAGFSFGVNIIPHTLAQTTLGGLQPGQAVNLEVDLIARYLERLLECRNDAV